MITLTESAQVFGTSQFQEVFKKEVESLDLELLPLQQALTMSSYVADASIKVMILNVSEIDSYIRVKAGIFYKGLIPGCNCADDPTPVDENTEYCEVMFEINMHSGETQLSLL